MAKKKKQIESNTPPVESASGKKAIEIAMKSLRKKFGDETVSWVSEVQTSKRDIISTTSLALDSALGVGGIARGRIYEFYGPNASGKTTLALLVIKDAIAQGHRALFIDAEHTLDTSLLVSMGIDLDRIVVTRGYTGEDNLDIAESMIATGEFAVCVIDSISALQPAAEANLESFSDNTMGLQPRLMSRMCRTFTSLVSRTNTALILINQIRANIGGYGNPETTSGRSAIQHHVSGRLRITGGGVKSRQIKNGKGEVTGHRMSVEVTKNKLAAPYRSAEIELMYGHGFNIHGEILDLGVDMGFIDQAGAYFKIDGELLGQGRAKAIVAIESNDKLRNTLLVQIKTMLGMEVVPAAEPELKVVAGEVGEQAM
jgi:recombination protein RecA